MRDRDVLITAPLPGHPVEVKLAGEALASLPASRRRGGPGIVDAIVMASAAGRGDVVFTTDVGDLEELAEFFRSVRVLSI